MKGYALLPVLLILASLMGCQHPQLKVAILASYGGAKEGAQLAVGEWNARGGVLGRRITTIVKITSVENPYSAVMATREAIDTQGARYIVGDVFSVLSIAASDVANAARVIQITPSSTNVAVTTGGAGKPYVFRACFDDAEQGEMGARFAFRVLKARKAFIMRDLSDVYVKDLAEMFEAAFTRLGGKVVGKENYSYTETDFSGTLARIGRARPDVVYLSSLTLQVVNLAIKQAREQGVAIPFLGGDGWDNPSLDPESADGSYFTTHYRPDDPRPQAKRFQRAYFAEYHEAPNFVAALFYDAVNLLMTAIRVARTDNTDAVRMALEKVSLDGATGRIVMNARHTPVKDLVVLHVTGGKIVFDSYLSP